MKLTETVKGFLKMSGHYSGSAVYLAEHGYDDRYMQMLAEECDTAGKSRDKAEGQALTAQALLFRGELKAASEEFDKTPVEMLPKHVDGVFANNMILCLFLLDKPQRIREVYRDFNKVLLGENTLVMRRTIGIKEYIDKRYENAVTVFIKLLSCPDPRATLMADICMVKALLKLDMRERAGEIAEMVFRRYAGKREITEITNRLNMEINGKPVKNQGKKKHRKR